MRIAVLEDEPPLLEQMTMLLESAGHVCYPYRGGKAIVAALKRETFDLLILDWNLPDIAGIDVLAWAREHVEHLPPVLFVTSRGEEADIVRALDLGADDYVVKPIRGNELLARVGALLRRNAPVRKADVETFGEHRFDTRSTSVAIAGGEPVVLTQKEFGLALLMFQNLDRALSRAYLLERVWGRNPDLLTRTLDAHVSRIRIKLNLRPEAGYRLAPVYSYGYRLERVGGGGAGG